jgi:hypothetical protein
MQQKKTKNINERKRKRRRVQNNLLCNYVIIVLERKRLVTIN